MHRGCIKNLIPKNLYAIRQKSTGLWYTTNNGRFYWSTPGLAMRALKTSKRFPKYNVDDYEIICIARVEEIDG